MLDIFLKSGNYPSWYWIRIPNWLILEVLGFNKDRVKPG